MPLLGTPTTHNRRKTQTLTPLSNPASQQGRLQYHLTPPYRRAAEGVTPSPFGWNQPSSATLLRLAYGVLSAIKKEQRCCRFLWSGLFVSPLNSGVQNQPPPHTIYLNPFRFASNSLSPEVVNSLAPETSTANPPISSLPPTKIPAPTCAVKPALFPQNPPVKSKYLQILDTILHSAGLHGDPSPLPASITSCPKLYWSSGN